MKSRIIFVITLFSCLEKSLARRRLPPHAPGNVYDQYECQNLCPYSHFNCDCEKPRSEYLVSSRCVPTTWMCDGVEDCEDGSDEFQCSCPEDHIQCSICEHGSGCSGNVTYDLYHCAQAFKTGDFEKDCLSFKDEPRRLSECVFCDGIIDCPHLTPHDEANCSSCPSSKPKRCDCNVFGDVTCNGRGQVCYASSEKCDGSIDCTDASDETGCSCSDEEFMCQCYKKSPTTCFGQTKCIPMYKYHDGIADCPDGSDESQFHRVAKCGNCDMAVYRFDSKSECDRLSFPSCDISSCFTVPSLSCSSDECATTQVICTSHCPKQGNITCGPGFQCADGSLALLHQFCDGKFDCPDNSDEATNQPGLNCNKPTRSCILPQRNLFDVVPHCPDESDLCLQTQNRSCFKCLNNEIYISTTQVCNGVIDCPDASDECLCDSSSENPSCQFIFNTSANACNKATQRQFEGSNLLPKTLPLIQHKLTETFQMRCQTKWGTVSATLCDGRPECSDFSDECNCKNPPQFCTDICHSFYLLGDRYCDGVEDDSWIFINNTACPKGFDERLCPKRFMCKAGHRVSIDVSQLCDGTLNCDDGSDERNCSQVASKAIFSSSAEMIENPAIRFVIWFLAVAALVGNVCIMITVVLSLRKEKMKDAMRFQYIIMMNIAIADLLMGVYLLTVSIQSLRFSERYGVEDFYWRTSPGCSAIGTLAFISSEASCFFMLLLTTFLLFNVCRPPKRSTSNLVWKIFIGIAWIAAILIATIPHFPNLTDYFRRSVWLVTPFSQRTLWNNEDIKLFTCRLASISNTSSETEGEYFSKAFFETNFPDYAPLGEFGFFSYTSICMPEIFAAIGGQAWEYVTALIALNFVCFLFIAVNYFIVCKISTKRHQDVNDERLARQESRLQRHIARIIFTNLICWIVIAVFAFLTLGGVQMDNVPYIISVVLLLPVNSAINPFLFSSLPEQLVKFLCCKKMEKVRLF